MMKFTPLLLLLGCMSVMAQDNYNLVVGTYTNTCESKGIYVYDFNAVTGDSKLKSNTEGVVNPSYLTVSNDNKFIYSVNEDGSKSEVSSFKYTPGTGKISLLNKKDAKGDDPCYIINDDKHVIVANYTDGSIAVFDKEKDGALSKAKQVVKHSGSSVNKERQAGPHVHMVNFSPDKKYVFATDLGADKIYIYSYNPAGDHGNILTLADSVDLKPGSGPRHLVFNPNSIFFYVLSELDASLTAFSYYNGKIEQIQQLSVQLKDFTGKNGAAHIQVTQDGKYLYATNRGDANTIAVFKVHSNGMLNFVQELYTQGEGPRNFAIDPKGNFLLVANQNTNDIIIFKRDKTTGMLSDTGKCIQLCAPVCLVFTPAK